ncbi:MAG: DUF1925 domain-containing protein, partial [Planctomycetaceae bacterium]|nr:DUF1925 domain-containing protein [Planctomycetaceae bacterium]
MDTRLRLVLALHNHQPIGNFDGVCEAAFQDSYLPFLETLAEYPELPIALHTSGSLLEWLESAHPEYIDRVRMLADRGQIEILGGPYYEPILACIPARDRTGQILAYTSHLERTFGTRVRGMWVPERVWEQSFTRDICRAGMEYSILDDHHFRSAGLEDHQLFSYFLTEDEGHLLKLFPGSEKLRYTIPFAEPHETIDYLREVAAQRPGGVVVFGDDGEKFGTWPGTKDHVYAGGWLRRFFDALMDNRDWLKLTTLGEAVDQVAPEGRHYVPDSSYREMTEWALPTDRQTELKHLNASLEHHHDFPRLKRFMRGGFWRNFLVKYPEANAMYTRMLEVSGRIDTLGRECPREEWPAQLAEAQKELYRGQCN